MTMFGLAVIAAIVLTISGSMLFTGLAATGTTIQHLHILSAFGGSEWTVFIVLLLGWLAAMATHPQASPRSMSHPATCER